MVELFGASCTINTGGLGYEPAERVEGMPDQGALGGTRLFRLFSRGEPGSALRRRSRITALDDFLEADAAVARRQGVIRFNGSGLCGKVFILDGVAKPPRILSTP